MRNKLSCAKKFIIFGKTIYYLVHTSCLSGGNKLIIWTHYVSIAKRLIYLVKKIIILGKTNYYHVKSYLSCGNTLIILTYYLSFAKQIILWKKYYLGQNKSLYCANKLFILWEWVNYLNTLFFFLQNKLYCGNKFVSFEEKKL